MDLSERNPPPPQTVASSAADPSNTGMNIVAKTDDVFLPVAANSYSASCLRPATSSNVSTYPSSQPYPAGWPIAPIALVPPIQPSSRFPVSATGVGPNGQFPYPAAQDRDSQMPGSALSSTMVQHQLDILQQQIAALGDSLSSLIGEKLNGQNYFLWSQSVRLVLMGCYKFGYLTGEIASPRPGDPQEILWKGEDAMIRSMLINCMEPQIGIPLMYVSTAKDIWDAVEQLYSKRHDGFHLYTLWKQIHDCKQGTMNVITYFNKLSMIWQEIDVYTETVWDCPCGGVQYHKLKAIDRVFTFLRGLNSQFDGVRGRILSLHPIPSLIKVCSEIRLEEDRYLTMNIPGASASDSAAFNAKMSGNENARDNSKPIPVCEHCKKQWHTKEQCWKLHGRPSNNRRRPPHHTSRRAL